jgi:PadR family transcriptional regulator AphA
MSIDHAILGVISRYPCSGYDIKTEFEHEGAGAIWGISFGSIYPRLKKLQEEELIRTYDAEDGGRKKTVYELTGKGWKELSAWLTQPAEYPVVRDELLLKLSFWSANSGKENRSTLIDHLTLRRIETTHKLNYFKEWPENGHSSISEYNMLVIDYVTSQLEAELKWIDSSIQQLEGPPLPFVQDPNELISKQQERRQQALKEEQSKEK